MSITEVALRKTLTVNAPIDKAFRVFTEGFDTWWPRSHKIGNADLKQAVIEGREGGRWYEVGADGSECDWGRVLVWDPPARLVLAWQIDGDWHYDPGFLTEVEVLFVAEGPDRTRVEFEHRDLDRFGEAKKEIAEAFDSEGGWTGLLAAYAQAATA
ncbi:MAG TPA: SRPBCC family protein [Streptosporangiaceae bacterium]|nr:SRPBCC family protein [Streptosporangiaceae bacterium]